MNTEELSQLLDVILDDLSARFIINLPEEELSDVTRICFGLEQAHWFYEDFFRPQYPALPSVNLRQFTAALFSHCPLLWPFKEQHETAFADFMKYKIRVPVRGAIMLNHDMTQCVLVRGWKANAGWGFPKGKIDQDEDDSDCAIREIREECGFDITSYVKTGDFIEMVIKEQQVKLYIVREVPMDTNFEPQTRKEIGKIDWFKLDDLPTYNKEAERSTNATKKKYYMVAPFLGPLRNWIKRQRKAKKGKQAPATAEQEQEAEAPTLLEEQVNFDDSSQALKLLLGISTRPEAPSAKKESEEAPSKYDLLAMLRGDFAAPASVAEATPQPMVASPQKEPPLLPASHLPEHVLHSPPRPPIPAHGQHPGQQYVPMPQPPPGPNPFFNGASPHVAFAQPMTGHGPYPPGPPMFFGLPGMPPYPSQQMGPPPMLHQMQGTHSGPFSQQVHPMPPPNLHLLQQQQHNVAMRFPPPNMPMPGSPQSMRSGPMQQLPSPQRYQPMLASPQPVRAVPMPLAGSSSPTRPAQNSNASSLLAILKPQGSTQQPAQQHHYQQQPSVTAPLDNQQQQQQQQQGGINLPVSQLFNHNTTKPSSVDPMAARDKGTLDESPIDPSISLSGRQTNKPPTNAPASHSHSLLDLLKGPSSFPVRESAASHTSQPFDTPVSAHVQHATPVAPQLHDSSAVPNGYAPSAQAAQSVSLLNLFKSTPPPSIAHLVAPAKQPATVPESAAPSQRPDQSARQTQHDTQDSLLRAFQSPRLAQSTSQSMQPPMPPPVPSMPDSSSMEPYQQQGPLAPPLPPSQPANQAQHLSSLLGSLKMASPASPPQQQPAALLSLLMQKPMPSAEQALPRPPQTHQQSLLTLLTPSGKT